MTPDDRTHTSPPDATRDQSDAALDAGLAAAFAGDTTRVRPPSADPEAGTVIAGKYRLSEKVGEGGMGSVWVAHQTEPVKRKVAVKLIKAGMDSKQVLARFDAERQALAVMDHPNIAKVLDGGLRDGRPFFVMELVKGVPITDYCDARKLTPQQRLELFIPVCQAIQHAHQKGVIHRDIKPSNVLVALYDDRAVPKVIDFGVAKATGAALTEHTLETGFGAVVGTPAYMSPEQASLNNLDIDTRSDVYALGVLLYELLTGSPPFTKADLERKGLLEMLRVVREEEPPRPSAKLSTADTLPSLAAVRGTEPKKLTGLLRNELDWIVMKALEKDRARRYETANGFAADVQRYLSGEPVQAHPPTAGYRLRKFVRKHRGPLVAGGLVLFALLAGFAGTVAGLVQADEKRREAEQARHDEAEQRGIAEANEAKARAAEAEERKAKLDADARRTEAEKNLAFAKKSNVILGNVFIALNPSFTLKTEGDLRDALRNSLLAAARDLDQAGLGDPAAVAEMMGFLGLALVGLDEANAAAAVLKKSSELFSAVLGRTAPKTLVSRQKWVEAEANAGRPDAALKLAEEALDHIRRDLGEKHDQVFFFRAMIGYCHMKAHREDKALPFLEDEYNRLRDDPKADKQDVLTTTHNLADCYSHLGRHDDALPMFREVLKKKTETLGPNHPNTLLSALALGDCLGSAGVRRAREALPLFEDTLKRMRAKLGPDHPHTLRCLGRLAATHAACRSFDLALPMFEDLTPRLAASVGENHETTLGYRFQHALCCEDADKPEKAVVILEDLVKRLREVKAAPTDVAQVMEHLVICSLMAGNGRRAAEVAAELVELVRKDSGAPTAAAFQAQIAANMLACNDAGHAEPLLRESLAVREKESPDDWTTANTRARLGQALLMQKKYADAEPLLIKGYEGMKAREKDIPPESAARIPDTLDQLVQLYTATDKPDEAKRYKELRSKYPEAKTPEKK